MVELHGHTIDKHFPATNTEHVTGVVTVYTKKGVHFYYIHVLRNRLSRVT